MKLHKLQLFLKEKSLDPRTRAFEHFEGDGLEEVEVKIVDSGKGGIPSGMSRHFLFSISPS